MTTDSTIVSAQSDSETDNITEFEKRRVFTDPTFTLLRNAQWKIYNATGFTPDFSKLLENMITEDACETTVAHFIKQLG